MSNTTAHAAHAATAEQLRARLELRRSSAASRHRNRRREALRPGRGNRGAARRAAVREG